MQRMLIATLACVGTAAAAIAQDTIDYQERPGSMEFSGRLIVRPVQFNALADRGLAQAQIEAQARQAEAVLDQYELHWYEPLVDHHVILIPEGHTENTLADQLMGTGLFEFAEPDWILYPVACPDDSNFDAQWHHADDRMQSCLAWDIHTGTPDVTVAICDTGIDTDHADLALHRKEGYNSPNRDWENDGGQVEDINGHGTHVTGCAAANGDNGIGVSGVGWNFSHRMMRVSNSSGGGASLSDLTHAALTAIEAGDTVANVSYSGVNNSSVRSTATAIKDLGGLMTWAAGNDAAFLNWGDRDEDDIIVVGNSDSADQRRSSSAFGPSVDFFAPGTDILSTTRDGSYGNSTGTSMAAPIAAGLFALVWSANPDLTADEVESIVKQSCDDIGDSNTFGYGRVNAYQALLLAGPPCLADFNADDTVDTQDVLAFLNAWSAGDDSADANDDGAVDTQDVLAFLNLWNAGC